MGRVDELSGFAELLQTRPGLGGVLNLLATSELDSSGNSPTLQTDTDLNHNGLALILELVPELVMSKEGYEHTPAPTCNGSYTRVALEAAAHGVQGRLPVETWMRWYIGLHALHGPRATTTIVGPILQVQRVSRSM
jgi:hypothetical protein